MKNTFKPEALPFVSGIFTGIGIALIVGVFGFGIGLDIGRIQKHEAEFAERQRTQYMAATCFLKDANHAMIQIAIRTKADLNDRWMKHESNEFIHRVCAQHMTTELDEMAKKFKDTTVSYLGLPEASLFMHVAIEPAVYPETK